MLKLFYTESWDSEINEDILEVVNLYNDIFIPTSCIIESNIQTYNLTCILNLSPIRGVHICDYIGIYSDSELRGIGCVDKTNDIFNIQITTNIEYSGVDELTAIKIFRRKPKNYEYGYLITLRITDEIVLNSGTTTQINWVTINDPFAEPTHCDDCTNDDNNCETDEATPTQSHWECVIS